MRARKTAGPTPTGPRGATCAAARTAAPWDPLLIVAAVLTGCGDAGDGAWQGSRETLPNGAIRVTNAGPGVWGEDDGWRLVPELQIGVEEGAPEFPTFSVRTERAGMVIGVPFAPAPVYRLDGDGGLWHGHGAEFRIVRSALEGDTLMEIVLHAEPAPVTAAELAEWEAGQSIARFRDMGGRIDMSRIPSSKPQFDDFLSDPDGHLWVSVPGAPGQIHFAIFDGDGRYLGRLRIDGARRENAVAPVIRNGRLHLVGRDDLDVQRVHVFRIER